MKTVAKKLFHIHVSDWRLGLVSLLLLSFFAVAMGAGIGLALLGDTSVFGSVGLLGGGALILLGAICFFIWKRTVWDKFAHHLIDLS